MKESIYVFNDGSIESKILQHELKDTYDIHVFDVKPYTKLDNWLTEVIDEDDSIKKVFLHFPMEDYIQKGIRDEIMNAHRLYPKLRIIAWYEQAHRDNLRIRAQDYGIKEDQPKFKKVSETKVAEDVIKPEPTGGHESISDEFTKKLEEYKDKRRRKKE